MKKILISPKILPDKYGQYGQFLDLSWINFFQKKVDILTWIPQNKNPVKNFDFDGVILSGGNDLYSIKKKKENLIRDKFESKLLKFAMNRSIPILAICRGFQFVNDFFGGSLKNVQNHIKTNHDIIFQKKFLSFRKKKILNINSYHNYKIKNLANNFQNIAETNDSSIEIAYAKQERILGLMFHPERKNFSQPSINKLVFNYFKIK